MPSNNAVEAWISLWRSHQFATAKVKSTIKNNAMPPIEWYDVLLELERGGEKGMRPFEIEKKLLFPQYSLSRLLNKLEQDGLISRTTFDEDKRGQVICITGEGRELRQKMWPIYAEAIHEAIDTKLTSEECMVLQELLDKLRN